MRRTARSDTLAQSAAYLYACMLVTVLYLFLPFNGYERMMEGKYHCFLLLSAAFLLSMLYVTPFRMRRMSPAQWCAAAYAVFSALSAACSPYGVQTLLGGTRKDGLVTIVIYVAGFYLLSRHLHADHRLLYLTAASASLCDILVLAQLAGYNPLRLYPEELNYYAGDVVYAGFYAGVSGNIDFTAFLLALAVCVMTAALIRERLWGLCGPLALTLYVLYRLGVAAAWLGLAFSAVWGLALLFPERRRAALLASATLSAAVLALAWCWNGPDGMLYEASRLLHGDLDPAFGSGRLAIWRDCLPLVRQRPLLGGGPDTLWLRGMEPFTWYRDGAAVPVDITAAHNEYLNILVNQGAPALTAHAAVLGSAVVRCFREADKPCLAICGTALLCYAAMAFFSISTCITAPYVWLLLALVHSNKIVVEI